MHQTPAVVLYMSYSGLAIVRSLGKKNIPVYAMDPDKNQIGMNSRYCESIVCPSVEENERKHVDFLIDFAKKLKTKPMLYATGDNTVLCYAKYEDELKDYFYYTNDKKENVYRTVPKINMYETAVELGIDVPKSYIPHNQSELKGIFDDLKKPFILKPSYSNTWYVKEMAQLVSNQKCIVINDYDELCQWYDILSKNKNEIIISEIVPGPDQNLYYVPSYRTRNGKYLGIFVGQKVRVTPVHFGSASYVELCKRSELEILTKQILDKLNYVGLSGVEYKYDEDDNKYKLIEINARYGLWDCLGEKIGIDLAYIAYCDVLGIENGLDVVEQPEDKKKVAWLSFERDIDAFLGYKRENDIQIVSWLRTLVNVKKYSVFDIWDLSPYLSRVKRNFFNKYLKYFLRKIPGFSLGKVS